MPRNNATVQELWPHHLDEVFFACKGLPMNLFSSELQFGAHGLVYYKFVYLRYRIVMMDPSNVLKT